MNQNWASLIFVRKEYTPICVFSFSAHRMHLSVRPGAVSIYNSSNVNTASGMRVLFPFAISIYRVRETKSLTLVLSSVVFAFGVCLPESLYIGCCVDTGFGQHNTASRMRVTN